MTWTDSLHRLASQLTAHQPSLYPAEELDDLMDIRIGKLQVDGFEGERLAYAQAVKAGLHLFNESLDASHELSQQIHHASGSYWHGIMHRMEGDYSNAKYWFHRAGRHPIHGGLAKAAAACWREADASAIRSEALRAKLAALGTGDVWDAGMFVDAVEQQVTMARDEAAEALLKRLQWLEMSALLEYCFTQSGGGGKLLGQS